MISKTKSLVYSDRLRVLADCSIRNARAESILAPVIQALCILEEDAQKQGYDLTKDDITVTPAAEDVARLNTARKRHFDEYGNDPLTDPVDNSHSLSYRNSF